MRASFALALLALAACDRQQEPNEAVQPKAAAAAKPAAIAPAVPADDGKEVQIETLTGVWKVTAVEAGPGAKFRKDDPRIVGALMDVFPDQVSWSYRPSPDFASSETCMGPVSGVIEEGEFASRTRKLLAPAIARVKARLRASRPHQWLCGDGGSWGDDAEFLPLGEGRMAMRWPGDLTLILERIKRPPSNPQPLPPTGAYEDR